MIGVDCRWPPSHADERRVERPRRAVRRVLGDDADAAVADASCRAGLSSSEQELPVAFAPR